ncbi:BTAD domain-containing putative transcriptional regulator [Streptomyces sp. NPDC088197]|uniref:AfsR/SARP family transcriptional regulator n=1 Tax=Streptomyces sp. NPDC088197 TaxID=3365840 RepID=UPI00382F2A95
MAIASPLPARATADPTPDPAANPPADSTSDSTTDLTGEPTVDGQAPAAPVGTAVRFRVLGSLEVRGSQQVAVTARRQQIVLALLLLETGRGVGLETMVNAVWGGAPPATARSQVQTAVSALRQRMERAGLGKRIRMHGLGYTLDLAPGELDLHVFDELAARGRAAAADGRPAAARAAFREALDLWNGDPLPEVDSPVVQTKLVRISERRFEVLEECLDAELRLGLHHEVLGEISALAAEFPLRERPAVQLMTALYRCGRQAEALAAYHQVRRTFIEELGIEPGPVLLKLELAILNGSGDLDLPQTAAPATVNATAPLPLPRMLPARITDFTGHADVLAELTDRLSAPSAPMAVITGCAGVGKSALAVEAAHALAPAFADGQLYARLPVGAGPREVSDVLERFLRALGFTAAAVPESLDGRSALYRSALAERRMLVVVEDAADVTLLRPLVPGTPTCGVLVTSRARLSAPADTYTVELEVPQIPEAVELLAAMTGRERVAAEPSEAIELAELCDGLPLALRAAAARLSARPHWSLAQLTARLRDERRRLDELFHQGLDVRAALRGTYEQLAAPARQLFARLGGLPTAEFPAWAAAPLLDVATASAVDVLETLVDARLVDPVGGSGVTARYRLRGLTRLHAAECLAELAEDQDESAPRRRLLGAWLTLADEALLRQGGTPAAELHHPTRWPMELPMLRAVLSDPGEWYGTERESLLAAVRQAADVHETEACWHLAVAVGALAAVQRAHDDWRAAGTDALRATQRAGDSLGEAAILFSLGTLDLRERRYEQATARLRGALGAFERLGADSWREAAAKALERLARETGAAADGRTPRPGRGGAGSTPATPVETSAWGVPATQRRYGLAASTGGSGTPAARTTPAPRSTAPRHRPAASFPTRRRTESVEEQ